MIYTVFIYLVYLFKKMKNSLTRNGEHRNGTCYTSTECDDKVLQSTFKLAIMTPINCSPLYVIIFKLREATRRATAQQVLECAAYSLSVIIFINIYVSDNKVKPFLTDTQCPLTQINLETFFTCQYLVPDGTNGRTTVDYNCTYIQNEGTKSSWDYYFFFVQNAS